MAPSRKLQILVYSTLLFFMFYRVGSAMFNADAHFWYTRSLNFSKAVLHADWPHTYQNPKPGVTVMWLSGFGLQTFFATYHKVFGFTPELYTYDTYQYVELAAVLPLLVVILLLYSFSFVVLKKLTNTALAFTALIFLFYQPFFVGVTRYLHGDGLLTALMFASSISGMYFLKNRSQKYLLLSGFFAGLAFLTKMQGFFLVAYIPLVLFLGVFRTKGSWKTLPAILSKFCLVFLLTIFAFFPALWVQPTATLRSMFSEASHVTTDGNNGGDGSYTIYARTLPKIFSPLCLVFLLPSFVVAAKKKKDLEFSDIYVYSVLFAVFYSLQMLLVFQKSERYLMPLFPFISLLAAFGLYAFRLSKTYKLLTGVLVGTSILYMGTFAPHYTAMIEEAPWGALYVEAANYLNAKSDVYNLKVVAVPKEHTFRPFFKGKTYGKDETLPNNWSPDYLVVANEGYIPKNYAYCVYETDIIFKKKVFWEIYRCK